MTCFWIMKRIHIIVNYSLLEQVVLKKFSNENIRLRIERDIKKKIMSDTGLVVFRGESGRAYPFHACPMDTILKNVGAVYALTKRRKGDGGKDFHSIFYIGQTASLGETVARHRKDPWLEQFQGNCVCIHLE